MCRAQCVTYCATQQQCSLMNRRDISADQAHWCFWLAGWAGCRRCVSWSHHLARVFRCRVVAHLRYGDGLASPEMVCSTAFDRDDEFFATAGVSRHVKVRPRLHMCAPWCRAWR